MKKLVSWMWRPFTDRLFHRMHTLAKDEAGQATESVQDAREFLWGEIRALQLRTDKLELETARTLDAHLPVIVERLSAHNADARHFARESSRLGAAQDELRAALAEIADRLVATEARAEFIRREFMHELRYGGERKGVGLRGPSPASSAPSSPDGPVLADRVNLGCGHIPLPGYVNVDARPLPGVDVVADVTQLPFAEASLKEIRSAHLLEHFPIEQLRRSLLPYFKQLLAPGGRLVSVVPDSDAMLRAFHEGTMSFEDLRLVTFGEQEYDGDFHFTMFTPESLCALLEEIGFDASVVTRARRNGVCFECEVVAVARSSTNERGA